jgi:recombinational DNA repair protein (RecF pathway)
MDTSLMARRIRRRKKNYWHVVQNLFYTPISFYIKSRSYKLITGGLEAKTINVGTLNINNDIRPTRAITVIITMIQKPH